jgi:uncharacterized oxidoreductase
MSGTSSSQNQRAAIVTGASSGIGLAIARMLGEQGYGLTIASRRPEKLEAAASELADAGNDVQQVAGNMNSEDVVRQVVAAHRDRFGRLDVLVNNAGTFVERDFANGTDVTVALDEEIDVNLRAPIELTNETLRRWSPLRAIVFVTSGFALVSPMRAPTYGAVKAGLHGFADGLRHQLAPLGTHVLELLPPTTDTAMNAGLDRPKLAPSEVAAVTLDALTRRRRMALPGQTRFLPTLLRVAPRTLERTIARL